MKKFIQWSLFLILCFVTLVALFYAEEDWRGRRDLNAYLQDRIARGDSFEWAAIAPPPIPDAENFAATPLFAELFPKPLSNAVLNQLQFPNLDKGAGNWREGRREDLAAWQKRFGGTNDLLTSLAQYDPVLKQIRVAAQRPKARYPIRYEDSFMTLLPHLSPLRQLARICRLRALAELAAGRTDAAAADTLLALRLGDTIADEPILISFLVRGAIIDMTLQPVWEGLTAHRWTAPELAKLQTELESTDRFADFSHALRGERMFGYSMIRWLIAHPKDRWQMLNGFVGSGQPEPTLGPLFGRSVPTGWLYQNLLTSDRFFTETYLPVIDFEQRQVSPKALKRAEDTLLTMHTTPYNAVSKMILPAITQVAKKLAQSQTAVDQATVACALERYRLARGAYPDNLATLVPDYLKRIPADVISGEPLHYRRTAPDQFVLYSVGWNGTDDGGEIAFTGAGSSRRQDFDHGDWVWPSQPAPSEEK